eukprot:5024792-Heterocapsa_arctica.AAC.1
MRSYGVARHLGRPAAGHAARWSPRSSRSMKHDLPLHCRAASDNGSLSRRSNNTLKRAHGMLVSALVGIACKRLSAAGPDRDRNIAASGARIAISTTCALWK